MLLLVWLSACFALSSCRSAVAQSGPVSASGPEQKSRGGDTGKKADSTEDQAYLGILYLSTIDGVVILEVFPDSPASRSGLRPYDLILSANGFPVIGPYTLKERILSLKPRTAVEIEVRNRDGGHSLHHVTLEPMPDRFRKKGQGAAF